MIEQAREAKRSRDLQAAQDAADDARRNKAKQEAADEAAREQDNARKEAEAEQAREAAQALKDAEAEQVRQDVERTRPLIEASEAGDLADFIEPAQQRMRRRPVERTIREIEAETRPEVEAVTAWHDGDNEPIRRPPLRAVFGRLCDAVLKWAGRVRDDQAEAEELPEDIEPFDPLDHMDEDLLPAPFEPDSEFVQAAREASKKAKQEERARLERETSTPTRGWGGPSGPGM